MRDMCASYYQDHYSTVMPFGKHQGRPLYQIPTNYLEWLSSKVDMDWWLEQAVEQELSKRADRKERTSRRYYEPPVSRRYIPAGVTLDAALKVVEAGRRAVALRAHPDKGGDPVLMAAVNATSDYLLKTLPSLLGEEIEVEP